VSSRCAQKLARLQTIMAERAVWADQLTQVKCMHGWVLEVEHILDASLVQTAGESVSNETVGDHLDAWRKQMAKHLSDGTLAELEQECLTEFLRVLSNLRPYLVQCYNRTDFPRTNNDMERSIRRLKTQYRRISGRKNWNAYLLRYGRWVAYAAWWEQDETHRQQFEQLATTLDHVRWHTLRQETTSVHREQLTRFRFRHKRQAFLASLEARWEAAAPTLPLP
jgi:hypothetical protein